MESRDWGQEIKDCYLVRHTLEAFGLAGVVEVAAVGNVQHLAYHSSGVKVLLRHMTGVVRLTVPHYRVDRQRRNLVARCFGKYHYTEELDHSVIGCVKDLRLVSPRTRASRS